MRIPKVILSTVLSAPVFLSGCTNYSQPDIESLSFYQAHCPKLTEFDQDGDQILDPKEAREYADFLTSKYGARAANRVSANLTNTRYNMAGWPFVCTEITPAPNIQTSGENLQTALQELADNQPK